MKNSLGKELFEKSLKGNDRELMCSSDFENR
jgi:hypothetical protein